MEADIRSYTPLSLAFLGDAVFSLMVREEVLKNKKAPLGKMSAICAGIVSAKSQCRILKVLEPILSEREKDVVRRGANAKPHSKAKNASLSEYRKATGFEALIGYLHLTGQSERLEEIFRISMENIK